MIRLLLPPPSTTDLHAKLCSIPAAPGALVIRGIKFRGHARDVTS